MRQMSAGFTAGDARVDTSATADGLESQNRRRAVLAAVDRQIDETVGALPDVSNATHALHQGFDVAHATPFQRQTNQLLTRHAAREQVPLPLRKTIAGVDEQPGGSDGRDPGMNRLLHSLTMGTAVNRGSRAVVHAKTDHRPAVILAGLEDVDFVAALGSVLGDEHVSGL